ncbi:MAG: cellulase family glycosylhydrolase [Dysgonomonadaceae bacterium]|nr:cellulase family glycosylhydrolase [Dysgonamonadaceae bacterium]
MLRTRKIFFVVLLLTTALPSIVAQNEKPGENRFVSVKGKDLITPEGEVFLMKGINLGNWLNPEGYMFLFQDVNSYRLIDQALKEMVGPDFVNQFWRKFQENYITQDDIRYIRQTGMNSIRIPFHYKLFTCEDFMGNNHPNRGFELLDNVIRWCKEEGLYVVLDIHAAPGGQTGDNIDDSYGYPWLFESPKSQELFCSIWKRIAVHYADEPTVLGYDLLNEPIAHFFDNKDELNNYLEPLYMKATEAIREVDKNHIVIWGGAQWNTNFSVFQNPHFDDKMMYECHTYWSDTTQAAIQHFLDFREKTNLPVYMGETGENTDEWIGGFRRLLEKNRIGWHFWPYKKMAKSSCMVSIKEPKNWDLVVEYTKKDRSSFAKIRENRPDQNKVQNALSELLDNCKFVECAKNDGYIKALGMRP